MDMPRLKSLKVQQKFWRNIPEKFSDTMLQRYPMFEVQICFVSCSRGNVSWSFVVSCYKSQHALETSWVFKKMFSMVFGELGTLREQSKQASLHKKNTSNTLHTVYRKWRSCDTLGSSSNKKKYSYRNNFLCILNNIDHICQDLWSFDFNMVSMKIILSFPLSEIKLFFKLYIPYFRKILKTY